MKLFVLILLLVASNAEGNVLRLVDNNGRPYGSCVCVGRDEISRVWITAAHCVRKDGTCRVLDPETRRTWVGTVNKVGSNSFDIAVFRTRLDATFHGVWIAEELPTIGAEVSIVGYPGGGLKMLPRTAKIIGFRRDGVVIEDPFIGGESGGGVFNKRGELIGIISRGRIMRPVSGIAAGPPNLLRQMVNQDVPE